MGKTESGAIWLDKNFLSAYDYWQFWRNTDDRDVLKFLNIFTDLNIEEIKKLEKNNINNLKILLANKATEMLHGKDEANNAEIIAKETFSENSSGSNLPTVYIDSTLIENNLTIIDIVVLSKLESSKSEIRRLIKGSGIKINNEIITDEKLVIGKKYFKGGYLKLSVGKKRHIKIETKN